MLWSEKYSLGSYRIFSEKYLIVNDTTLRRIWFSVNTNNTGKKHNPTRDEICKFYKYPVEIR